MYLYVLIKVILFKFGAVDISFLWQQWFQALDNPDSVYNRLDRANFTPFKSIRVNVSRLSDTHHMMHFFGNIAIFIPNGVFMGFMFRQYRFIAAFLSSFMLSLGLECSQIFFAMGSFDVDDLILNTAGGILGYVIFIVLDGIYTREQHIHQEKERVRN
ncbi:VanZ family protein [Paenibacillus sp. JCM 10914]